MRELQGFTNTEPRNSLPEAPRSNSENRTILVWVISVFYFVSAAWVIWSVVGIFTGVIPLNDAQKEYFQSQSILDYGFPLLLGATNLTAAVLLFFLRKPAFYLFLTTFTVGIVVTIYQIFARDWLGVVGDSGLKAAVIGWIINIAVILYSKRLIDRGILR